ncbi:hypothetical protein HGRIS_005741 [Hohenbuehelia grisea]|uniref:JmjC domain-containing protein n=1 Tax=Hohenbuehelia grisea TaxID=104357 RepID=A0ABR3JZV0_9AGAR
MSLRSASWESASPKVSQGPSTPTPMIESRYKNHGGPMLQDAFCTRFRLNNKPLPEYLLCLACKRRPSRASTSTDGQMCRFKNLRRFLAAGGTDLLGGTFTNFEKFNHRVVYSQRIDRHEYGFLRASIAPILLPWIQDALKLVSGREVIARCKSPTRRDVCGTPPFPEFDYMSKVTTTFLLCVIDNCRWSLFLVSWTCEGCGMDLCEQCVQGMGMSSCGCGGNLSIVSAMDTSALKRLQADVLTAIKQAPSPRVDLKELDRMEKEGCIPMFNSDTIPRYFDIIWKRGMPFMVSDAWLQSGWSPLDLVAEFGHEVCILEDCESPQNEYIETTIADFLLRRFPTSDSAIYKMKDSPVNEEFQTKFPDRFRDFTAALPVKDYTAHNGVLNVINLYPTNCDHILDPGPRLNIAMGTRLEEDYQGTTRLGVNVADMVSILANDGEALWHIFPHEASDILRRFLRERFRCEDTRDPLHTQNLYLSPKDLAALERDYRIRPYTAAQTSFNAIFVPAGCAYQVTNITPCIQIAGDFLTPHSLARCNTVTEELYRMSASGARKLDVLEFRNLVLHSWLNLSRRAKMYSAAWEREAAEAERYAREHQHAPPPYSDRSSPTSRHSPASNLSPLQKSALSSNGPSPTSFHAPDRFLHFNRRHSLHGENLATLDAWRAYFKSMNGHPAHPHHPQGASSSRPSSSRKRPHSPSSAHESQASWPANTASPSPAPPSQRPPPPPKQDPPYIPQSVQAIQNTLQVPPSSYQFPAQSQPPSSTSSPQAAQPTAAATGAAVKSTTQQASNSQFAFNTFNVAAQKSNEPSIASFWAAQGTLNLAGSDPQWVAEDVPVRGQRRERHCVTCGGTPRECPGTQNQAKCRKKRKLIKQRCV